MKRGTRIGRLQGVRAGQLRWRHAVAPGIGGQANYALNVQGGASPLPVPALPQFPVRCPLGSPPFC